MTYDEARAFLEETKQYGSVLGLAGIQALMEQLSNVQEQLSVIHVAGTNGKGSTCAMLAAILQHAGLRVGRYSSPAVFSYEEIYQINGTPISPTDYAECMEQVKQACDRMVTKGKPHPTPFEIETAAAFLYFAKKKCDIVLLEVGMGGATDATNVIRKPVCAVLTDISRDHMGFLGETIAEIAAVKAGIIKKHTLVVSAEQQPEAMAVIEQTAEKQAAELVIADTGRIQRAVYNADGMELALRDRETSEITEYSLKLTGAYQVRNALLAVTTAEALQSCGYPITKEDIHEGISQAVWGGRFETIHKAPRIIIDGAHNEDAARQLRATIENCFTNETITYIIGVLADKEHEKILRMLLPYAAKVYTITPDNPRALDGALLCAEAQKYHSDVTNAASVKEAVQQAVKGMDEQGVILAFGSLSYLQEVKEAVNELDASWRQK